MSMNRGSVKLKKSTMRTRKECEQERKRGRRYVKVAVRCAWERIQCRSEGKGGEWDRVRKGANIKILTAVAWCWVEERSTRKQRERQ